MGATDGVSPAKSPVAGSVAGSESGGSGSGSTGAPPRFAGRLVKQFKLIDEIGEGPAGRVFLAEDTMRRRAVALKLLPAKSRDGRPNQRALRLIAEARAAAALEHPHIVAIHEIETAAGIHYIAMEFVEGGNLERIVQLNGPMEIERACQLVAEAATALAHAHRQGIIHRDIKPTNLLLTRSGRCKVCDFALAMVETSEGPGGANAKLNCVGMPYFVAPEVATGGRATAASDIYALGCTMFFLLTGRPPFSAPGTAQVLRMHVSDPLPDIRRWRADVPQRLIEVIAQACAKDPQRRQESAEQLAAVLRTFTISTPSPGGSGGGSIGSSSQFAGLPSVTPAARPAVDSADEQSSPDTRPRRRRVALWAGGALAAAAVVIALTTWLMRPASEKTHATATASTPTPSAPVRPVTPAAPATPASPSAPSPVVASATLSADDRAPGDMENLDANGFVRGWNVQARYRPQVTVMDEAGNHYLRVTNPDAGRIVYFDRKITLDPSWVAVTVSARMRASSFKAGGGSMQDGRVAILFKDAGGIRIGGYPPVPNVRGDSGWTVRTVTADVPPGAKSLQLQGGIFNATGTVDFDDITVVPQAGPASPASGTSGR
jgi:serine/threonine-protein kinase